ncbi:hypothetical protein Tsubulata_008129 [Turnera subulata]|uniref:Uncharacterized protein n=1 Tax=Turnera subulata TaxID=218843 RepID=A0A9Q0FMA1_9ROSI|nr:hypothetical protein Tsubulata_008129 [Turnera subulata]
MAMPPADIRRGWGCLKAPASHVHEDDDDGGRKRPSKRRRRLTTTGAEDADDTCPLTSLEASYKRIMLALTKPSYLLGHPALSSLRQESRARLLNLLRRLASRHDWTEAAGVLAVLLKGTRKDSSPDVNRFKYTASLEFVRHVDGDHFSSRKDLDMERLYSAWMIRAGINLSNKRKRHTREDSFLVRLEAILFQLVHGNVEAERHNVRSLMQEHEFEYHPLFNLIMGLMFYHLWYSGLPDHMRVKDSEGTHNSTDSDITASPSRSHMSSTCFSNEYGYPEGRNAIFNEEPNPSFQHDSSTSVGNDKQLPVERNADCCGEGGPVKADATQPQGFYRNSAENEASEDNNGGDNSTIYMSSFRELKLRPLRDWEFEVLTDHDEEYKNAVKYLRQAVNAKPTMLEALLPLIQVSKHTFCRLRAKLLEHAVPSNIILLSSCFEEALKSDPTSTEILEKLLSFHRNGEYGAESLLEMIALHLDAIFPGYNTWREFALCFLKVFLYEEDRMSVFMKGSEGAGKQYLSAHYNRIPKFFVHGKSGRAWQFRCKWWLRRYFNMSILASEIAAGTLHLICCSLGIFMRHEYHTSCFHCLKRELITYKAACASHMFGRESEYVAKAYSYLKTRNNRELSSFLQEHMHNSIGFALNSERRTNR